MTLWHHSDLWGHRFLHSNKQYLYLFLLKTSDPCLPSRQNLGHTLNLHCWALPLLPWWLPTVIFHLYSYMASKTHTHIQYVEFQSNAILSLAATVSGQETATAKRFQPDGCVGQSSVFWPRCWTSQQSDKNSACRSQTASAKLLNAQHHTFSQACITTGADARWRT